MAEAAIVARLRKKSSEAEDEEDVPVENSSLRPMMRSKTILDAKFKEYQEENRKAWIRSRSEAGAVKAEQGFHDNERLEFSPEREESKHSPFRRGASPGLSGASPNTRNHPWWRPSSEQRPSAQTDRQRPGSIGRRVQDDHNDRLDVDTGLPVGIEASRSSQSATTSGSRGSAAHGKGGFGHSADAIPLTKKKVSFIPSGQEAAENAKKFAKTPRGQGGQVGEWGQALTERATAAVAAATASALAAGAVVTGTAIGREATAHGATAVTASEGASPAAPTPAAAAGDEADAQLDDARTGGDLEILNEGGPGDADRAAGDTTQDTPPAGSAISADDKPLQNGELHGNDTSAGKGVHYPSDVPSWIRVNKDTGQMWRSMTADDLADAMSARMKEELGIPVDEKGGGRSGRSDLQSVPEGLGPDVIFEDDEDESESLLEERELQQIDEEVVQDIFNRLCAMEEKVSHYIDLCGFLLLITLYCTILFLQADSTRSYDLTSSQNYILPPGLVQGQSYRFGGPADFYNWLNKTVLGNIEADPPCGDGSCDFPLEFPAFGRFGCEADCGRFSNLTDVAISFSTSFQSKEQAAESSWNLCITDPMALCWYEEYQPFDEANVDFTVSMSIPDGDWLLWLNTPHGGVRGTVLTAAAGYSRVAVGHASTDELTAFGGCLFEDDAKNATCVRGCARVAQCMQTSCGRDVSIREASGAYTDCISVCNQSPASIIPLADRTCYQVALYLQDQFQSTNCNATVAATSTDSPKATAAAGVQGRSTLEHALSGGIQEGALAHPPRLSGCPFAAKRRQLSSDDLGRMPADEYHARVKARMQRGDQVAERMAVAAAGVATAGGGSSGVGAGMHQTFASGSVPASVGSAGLAEAVVGHQVVMPPMPLEHFSPVISSNATVWSYLGPTDDQRFYTLQVAVGRLVYTMVKDSCLSDHPKGLEPGQRDIVTAFLCTVLGGPVDEDIRCMYYDESGRQLKRPYELYRRMFKVHQGAGYTISAQEQDLFIQMLLSAVHSAREPSTEALDRMSSVLHWFDDAISDPSLPGCTRAGTYLLWRNGMQYNTTINVGDRVTWVWDDDFPHSIKVAGGDANEFFQGFGSDHLAVSRQVTCTPQNVGPQDFYDEPFPCVLRMINDPPNVPASFSYSRVFSEVGTVYYRGSDGRMPMASSAFLGTTGVLKIRPTPVLGQADSGYAIDAECIPGCKVIRLANGICESECNIGDCAFDGGDCVCIDPTIGAGVCPCTSGTQRRDDGSCCLSSAVGTSLSFPFSLRHYGLNATQSNTAVVATKKEPFPIWLGHNKLLVGIFLRQVRYNATYCNCSRLAQLVGWCSSNTLSNAPFGVNPHFLSTSSLYDPTLIANKAQFDNSSFGFKLVYNPQGLPYGFIYPKKDLSAYPLVFDVNLNYANSLKRMQYLVDGHYIDNQTQSVDVQLITFNGDMQKLSLMTVHTEVSTGGAFDVTYSSRAVPTSLHGDGASFWVLIVLESFYVLGLTWNVLEEVREMILKKQTVGTVLSYFENAWNFLDITSLCLQWVGVGLWITLWVYSDNFSMQPRYDIYVSLLEVPRYWAVPNPPTGFDQAQAAYNQLVFIVNLHDIYFTVQGINLFLMMVRALKLMDFQPYLGIITRSLSTAALSLIHFFLLAFIIFLTFAIFGFIVFGSEIQAFSTLPDSMLTCFQVLINDNGIFYSLVYLKGWNYISGLIFWFFYILLMVFILFNFLIAIIVDAFMDVKDSPINPTTVWEDVWDMWNYFLRRFSGPYSSVKRLEKHLLMLGAVDKRKEETAKILDRYQSMRRKFENMITLGFLFKKKVPGKGAKAGKLDDDYSDGYHTAARPPARQRVLKIKDHRIDETSLAVILDRRVQCAQMSDNVIHRHDRGCLSMREVMSQTIGQSMWGVFRVLSGHKSREDKYVDTDELSSHLLSQFGEVVNRHELPKPPPVNLRKLEQAKMKSDLTKTLQGVNKALSAMEELRQVVDSLQSQQQQILELQQTQQQQILAIMHSQSRTPAEAAKTPVEPSSLASPANAWGSSEVVSSVDGAASGHAEKSLRRSTSKKTKRKSLRVISSLATAFPVGKGASSPTAPQSPLAGPMSRPVKSMMRLGEGDRLASPTVGRQAMSMARLGGSRELSSVGRSMLATTRGAEGDGAVQPSPVDAHGDENSTSRGAEIEHQVEGVRLVGDGERPGEGKGEVGSSSKSDSSMDVFLSPNDSS